MTRQEPGAEVEEVPGESVGEGTSGGPPAPPPSSPGLLTELRPSWVVGGLYLATGALLALSVASWNWAGPPAIVTAASFVLPGLWAALAVAGLVLAVRSATALPARVLSAVQLGFIGLIWGTAWAGLPGWGGDEAFTVMSWNVQRLGWDSPEHDARVDCVVAGVEAADPDVITLLEVTAEDVDELSGRLGLRCEHVDYRGTGRAHHGGLAACSRGPDWELGIRAPRQFSKDLDWYYVFTEVVHGERTLNLMAVHLPPYGVSVGRLLGQDGGPAPEQTALTHANGTEALIRRIGALEDPTILAGDFNSARDAAVHVGLRQHVVDTWERAGWGPGRTVWAFGALPLRIDYLYVTPDFVVRSARIPAVDCADHRPVVSTLAWR